MERVPKRFTIQADQGAAEKVHTFQDVIQELQSSYPEVIGATLFGSLPRGQATQSSDIDAWVFIDSDAVAKKEERTPDTVFERSTGVRANAKKKGTQVKAATFFAGDVQFKYENEIRDRLSQRLGVRRFSYTVSDAEIDRFKDLQVIPLSKEGIESIVKDATTPGWRQPKQRMTGFAGNTKEGYLRFPAWMWIVVPMFHLSVGNGLRPYRALFLKGLLEHGDRGESVWKQVIEQLQERELRRGEAKREQVYYPKTLKEAVGIYAPELLSEVH